MKKVISVSKRLQAILLFVSLFLFPVKGSCGDPVQSGPDTLPAGKTWRTAGNPYLPLWEHLPDGEPRVFEDPDNPGKYRIYIIGSHDVRFRSYCGPDIRAWSAPVEDLSAWRDEGPIFTYPIDNQWDVMYAPDLVEVKRRDGTREYYLYPHSRGRNREAMIAKGSRPDGPFTPVNMTEDGMKTLPGSIMGFDPAVFIEYVNDPKDADYETGFRAYGFWGFQRSSAGQLDQNTMYSLRPGTQAIGYFIPASARYGVIRDPEGTVYPNVYQGEDLGSFNFFEAASIRKIGNKYVWVYSGYSGPDYGLSSTNSALRYAYGDSPLGPWKSGGVLVDSRAVVPTKDGTLLMTSYSGHNTHGSIELINDQWYVFYHRAPRGYGFARQPMVAPVTVKWDENPVAEGGKVTIRAYDPYSKDNMWTAKDSQGNEYTGAEVTSEGFHIYGLDPYKYYSAGYACFLSNTETQQDSWDIWDNDMPIGNVENGHIIGYKYFGFGGLAKDPKGLRAFKGTKPGNKTAINLFLTPRTKSAFKINVWLDGPWDNSTWNGKKIGEITVPANSAQEVTKCTADVSAYVDKLGGKHAVYLVAEGPDQGALFDLSGLGFSSRKNKIERPVTPVVSIRFNGAEIDLPATPVRSTEANGITGYDLYEAKYQIPAGTTGLPSVSASATDPEVKVAVTQADSNTGAAVVRFDYRGIIKTYRVVFEPAPAGDADRQDNAPVRFTTEQDHRNMMDQLGIKSLRPGPSGNESAPNHANYDESKATPYPDLPDLLELKNGKKVTTPEIWWEQRRPEIKEDLEKEVYGRLPEKIPAVKWNVDISEREFVGFIPVIAKKLTGHVDNSEYPLIDVKISMVLVTPANATGPVPVLMMFGRASLPAPAQPDPDELEVINNAFRRMLSARDPEVKAIFDKYPAYNPITRATGASPFGGMGTQPNADPPSTQQLLMAGWGYVMIDPASIQADNGAGLTNGIIGLVNKGQPRKPDDWGSLRAWAWGAARGLDYLETDPAVDAKHVGIEGVSRYGKAALVTLAFEDRFALALVGSSGKGGATLHRRNFGEAVESLTGSGEYHWMAGNYLKYGAAESASGAGNAGQLSVDSHSLIAMCAPRLTFISYGIPEMGDAKWLDQKGSYMATVAAGTVFKLLGAKDLGVSNDYKKEVMPPVNKGLLNGELAWRQHDGGHTDAPNMKYFIEWANKKINYYPGAQGTR